MSRAQSILDLCQKYVDVTTRANGLTYGSDSAQNSLLANGIFPHELDHSELLSAVSGISTTILYPGLNTLLTDDIQVIWMWCAEILLGGAAMPFQEEDRREHQILYQTIMRALSARTNPNNIDIFEFVRVKPHIINISAEQVIQNSSLAASYLVFPCLEALLKFLCHEYVDMGGKIKTNFSVQRKGKSTTYKVDGRECSSIEVLLKLHYNQIASPTLKSHLDRLKDRLCTITGNDDAFAVIGTWRNQSLHGQESFWTTGGTILNYCLLLSLSEIEPTYDARKLQALRDSRRVAERNNPDQFNYYGIDQRGLPAPI